jgi:hypothetical protein
MKIVILKNIIQKINLNVLKSNYEAIENINFFKFIYAAVIILVIIRCIFGVDAVDESMYLAIPYRFVLGDTPFVDQFLYSGVDFLNYTFIKLYTQLLGSTDYVILSTRIFYVFILVLFSRIVYEIFLEFISKNHALILSALCLLYSQFNILSLSYNTYCSIFLTSSFLILGFNKNKQLKWAIFNGICLSIVGLAYPPMALVIALIILASYAIDRNLKLNTTVTLFILISTALLFICAVLYFGIENYIQTFEYMAKFGDGMYGMSLKENTYIFFSEITLNFKSFITYYIALISILVMEILSGFLKINKNNINILYALLPVAIISSGIGSPIIRDGLSGILFAGFYGAPISFSSTYLFLFFTSLPILIWRINVDLNEKIRYATFFFVIPFVAGYTTSIFSVNHFNNVGIGVFIGLLISHFLIIKIDPKIGVFAVFFSIIFLLVMLYGGIHGEDRYINGLTSYSKIGPSGLIRSSADKVKFIEELQVDINNAKRRSDKTIVTNGVFPLIFLMSNLKPLAKNLWINSSGEEIITKRFYEKSGTYPDVLVLLNENKSGYLANLARSNFYTLAIKRERTVNLNWEYEIYLKNLNDLDLVTHK